MKNGPGGGLFGDPKSEARRLLVAALAVLSQDAAETRAIDHTLDAIRALEGDQDAADDDLNPQGPAERSMA